MAGTRSALTATTMQARVSVATELSLGGDEALSLSRRFDVSVATELSSAATELSSVETKLSVGEVLTSFWISTCKDVVVGNEQKSVAFWKRIADYFAASPKLAGCEKRETMHCKQWWQKINDLVCKFCGAYEAAAREKTSGQNENDILKQAHVIFFNNYKKKITLEHAWKELRHDQKWCDLSTERTSKKRKCKDGAHSSTSQATDNNTGEADEGTDQPPGVKAAKRRGKKPMEEGKGLCEFERMWSIKQ
ncbi:glutathione S-transferase T3-like [Brassica napus]|uniref:glutathione S-transferase T3-like n=1 Tax=Brassica napus TaxID=3708 RepID=UPI0006AB1C7E|nr:glutathione S-transferase T3-like [Brassica napus]